MPPLALTLPTVLHGVSGAGKTEYGLAHFEQPLLVRRRDDLKRISFMTDGLAFDDMSLRDWPPEDVIALLSVDKARSLPARYTDAYIPADMPIIFTTNLSMSDHESIFPRGHNAEQVYAISRRYIKVAVTGPLQAGGRAFTAEEMQTRRTQPDTHSTRVPTPPPAPPSQHMHRRILPSDYEDSDDDTVG